MAGTQEERRHSLRSVDDEQARQTRRRLAAAYRQAAAEHVTRLSVTWLCTRAGVARSTFYTHFADVDDLAAHAITEEFPEVSALDVTRRTAHHPNRRAISRAGLDMVVEALDQTRDVLDYATHVGSRAAVVQRLVALTGTFTRESVAIEYDHLDPRALDLVATFISAGTVHAVLDWMEEPTLSREALISQLLDVLPDGLTAP